MGETVLIAIAIFVLLLGGGLWIPFALLAGGIYTILIIDGFDGLRALGFVVWGSMNSATLSAVPLFILMAELLLRTGLSDGFYRGLAVLVRRLPGGLLQTNIAGCALFAAVSGSSVATAAAIGTVAIPQLKEKGYDQAMTAGTLAAGGTLGILIPPSIAMIVYGSFTDVSIAKLFLAGVIPGLLLTALFMVYVAGRVLLQPSLAPRETAVVTARDRFGAVLALAPLVVLMTVVLGSIYWGIATPTEAAAVGAAGAILMGIGYRRFSIAVLNDCLRATLKVSGAILFIVMGAFVFAYGIETSGVGRSITEWVVSLDLDRTTFLILVYIGYGIMGCFIDSLGMIVLTVPLLAPILTAMGIDLLWFGIVLVVVVELGQITPPLGINLFVIESIARRGLGEVIRGTAPYILIFALFLGILTVFPDLATWLPSRMAQ